METKLLKSFLHHTISKSDGKINISILDLSFYENNEYRDNNLSNSFNELDSLLIKEGHKKIVETDNYNVYANKDDDTELFVLQNKDYCITLIELI